MGAGWSAANGLHLQCHKDEYVCGDTVRAIVALNVVTPLELEGIEVQLKGYEATSWDEGRRRHYAGDFTFADEKTALRGSAGTFQPGQYQWPVVISMPPTLPGVFYSETLSARAGVAYVLQATGHTKGALKRALRSKVGLRVLAPPPLVQPVAVQCSMDFPQGCCVSRGTISTRLTLDRHWALSGGEVEVAVDVDNQSTLDVQSVGVSLWQARQFTVEPPPRDPLELFLEFRDERRVSQEQRLEGARAHTSVQGSLARRIKLQLPADLQPTHVGAIVRAVYHVRATLRMGMFRANLRLQAPLHIVIPRRAATAGAAAPAGPAAGQPPNLAEPPPYWKPQTVHDPVSLAVWGAPPPSWEALRADAASFARSTSNTRH